MKNYFAHLLREADTISDTELALKNQSLASKQAGDVVVRHLTKTERQIAVLIQREIVKRRALQDEHDRAHDAGIESPQGCIVFNRQYLLKESKIQFLVKLLWFFVNDSFRDTEEVSSGLTIRRYGLLVISDATDCISDIIGHIHDQLEEVFEGFQQKNSTVH